MAEAIATRRGPVASFADADGIDLEDPPRTTIGSRESRIRMMMFLWLIPITLAADEWRRAGFAFLASEMFWSKPWTRPVSVLLLVMWGYVFNNWVFSRSGINVAVVFGTAPPDTTDAVEAALAITWASATLHMLPVAGVLTHYTVMDVGLTDPTHHLLIMLLLAGTVVLLNRTWAVLRPFNVGGLLKILFECFTAPFAPVTFTHVIIADYLTSLAKTFADIAISSCVAVSVPVLSEWPSAGVAHSVQTAQRMCTNSSMVPLVVLIPTAVRVLQCSRVFHDSGDKLHLVNLVKYLTTVPVVLFSVLKKNQPEYFELLQPVWMIAVVPTPWDIMMDWGLLERVPGAHEGAPLLSRWQLRQTRRYPAIAYAVIIFLNAILRYTWSIKLLDFQLPLKQGQVRIHLPLIGGEATAFLFNALEVFRRNCWAVLRVEWEEVKNHGANNQPADRVMELQGSSPIKA